MNLDNFPDLGITTTPCANERPNVRSVWWRELVLQRAARSDALLHGPSAGKTCPEPWPGSCGERPPVVSERSESNPKGVESR